GRGVAQDDQQAIAWYRKAAERGDAAAQASLGLMYERGQGVTRDARQAVAWYRKAAERGDAQAQARLGHMYDQGRGVVQDHQQAYAWLSVAAANGEADAASTRDKAATFLTAAALKDAQALAAQYFDTYRPE
ncbi:tetratricopeptide repeat protein, partial [Aeromonas caviae]|uniref:tetratricopeptide repeat protein n=3 Tax=Aeromonas TaxID=642 RepID=UPI00132A761C